MYPGWGIRTEEVGPAGFGGACAIPRVARFIASLDLSLESSTR